MLGKNILKIRIVNEFQENRNALKNVWGDATVPYVIDPSLGRFWMF